MLSVTITLAGCGGSDEFVPPVGDVPDAAVEADAAGPVLRATGTATVAGTGAERVDCDFLLDIFELTDDGNGGWTATGAGEVPFWTELEVIVGAATGTMTWDGTWTCAPILPGDPDTMDLELDAPGTWMIGPV